MTLLRSGRAMRRGGARSGAAATEFALVLPVFILFMLGMVEFGRLFWVQVSLRLAVEQTARNAMAEYLRESYTSADFPSWFNNWTASLEAQAPDQIFGWDPAGVVFTATTEAATSSEGTDYVTIQATYTLDLLFDVVPGLSEKTLSASTRTPLVGAGNSFSS
jgi:Flp pilus assembly protein TadG